MLVLPPILLPLIAITSSEWQPSQKRIGNGGEKGKSKTTLRMDSYRLKEATFPMPGGDLTLVGLKSLLRLQVIFFVHL